MALYYILIVCLLGTSFCDDYKLNASDMLNNSSDLKRDMYVIHAMVYQVGILTNKTDNETGIANNTGVEEAITFFHLNGSKVDLSKIPKPLLANVTAQSFVGIAPSFPVQKLHLNSSWTNKDMQRYTRSTTEIHESSEIYDHFNDKTTKNMLSANIFKALSKREVDNKENAPVKIIKGTAVTPKAFGVQTLAIPPFLTFANNLTKIPVPIPNTSILQYAKVNALVHIP